MAPNNAPKNPSMYNGSVCRFKENCYLLRQNLLKEVNLSSSESIAVGEMVGGGTANRIHRLVGPDGREISSVAWGASLYA